MSQREDLNLKILQTLGTPLMAAVTDVAARGEKPEEGALPAQAEKMATLLAKSVQAGVALSQAMDIKENSDSADAVKLALSSVASSLIADSYRQTGNIPEDNDIQGLVTALGTTLAFADNFTVAPENVIRLETLEPGALPIDEAQINIQYIHTFVPLVNVVAAFSFGQANKKLVQDISGRLMDQAERIRKTVAPTMPDESTEARQAELGVLRALVSVYAACHKAEVQRLSSLSDEERTEAAEDAEALKPVWDAFDQQVQMIEMLANTMIPTEKTPVAVAEVKEATPAVAEVEKAPPAEVKEETPVVADAAPEPKVREEAKEEAKSNDNPMSFFAGGGAKKDDDNKGDAE